MRLLRFVPLLLTPLFAQPGVNPIPIGAMHTEKNQIVDSAGNVIVLRGAEIPGLNLTNVGADQQAIYDQALSPTTFSTMRQRWNMNALRLPISSTIAATDPRYLGRVSTIVRQANVAGLVVILAEYSAEYGSSNLPVAGEINFWHTWASYFKDNPMIVFDVFHEPSGSDWNVWLHGDGNTSVGMQALVTAIRSAGASQLIAVQGFKDSEFQNFDSRYFVPDQNIVYEVLPFFSKDLTDADRDAHFGFLASQVPMLAGEWGFIPGEDSANCRAVPSNPNGAEQVITAAMVYFESHGMSWTYSTFLPGNLYIDFSDYYRTDLVVPWTCGGGTPVGLGAGEPIQYYLDGLDESDLVPVSGAAGNIVGLARGAVTPIYGYNMASTTDQYSVYPPPLEIDGTSVRITDSKGISRLARLLYISPVLINAVVPEDTATGLATVEIATGVGAGLRGTALVMDTSPGLYGANLNGRGPVVAQATVISEDGTRTALASYTCPDAVAANCTTTPLPIPEGGSTTLTIYASGIRNLKSDGTISATIGGFAVQVLSSGIFDEAGGMDTVVLNLPTILKGIGETDLVVVVDGIASNAVRVNLQ